MPEAENADLALLVSAAHEAAEIALGHFRRAPRSWNKPGDAGPVSEADLEVDEYLRKRLTAARPGHGWLSEETPDSAARLSAREVFIVDPIDGTRAFLDGHGDWALSLALAREGQLQAAVVFLPAREKLYAARLGGGATLDGRPIRMGAGRSGRGTVLTTGASMRAEDWPGGVPPLKRHFRSSLAYRLSLVAEGAFDAMMTLKPTWEWDAAAGDLIAREAGAATSDRRGDALAYNGATGRLDGVIAARPALHADLMRRLGAA